MKKKLRKIYLASRNSRREELAKYADQILLLGHEITANWVRGNEGLSWEESAELDRTDVCRADLVIAFGDQFGSSNVGGARFFEQGLAYGKGIELWVVSGDGHEIIFHHLNGIRHFPDFEAVLRRLAH
jgi:nucleoside 2-deoxyribosyltransferase